LINEQWFEIYSEDKTVEQLVYLTVKSRYLHTTENNIRKHYRNAQIGKLLKKYDNIAFNLMVQEL